MKKILGDDRCLVDARSSFLPFLSLKKFSFLFYREETNCGKYLDFISLHLNQQAVEPGRGDLRKDLSKNLKYVSVYL